MPRLQLKRAGRWAHNVSSMGSLKRAQSDLSTDIWDLCSAVLFPDIDQNRVRSTTGLMWAAMLEMQAQMIGKVHELKTGLAMTSSGEASEAPPLEVVLRPLKHY